MTRVRTLVVGGIAGGILVAAIAVTTTLLVNDVVGRPATLPGADASRDRAGDAAWRELIARLDELEGRLAGLAAPAAARESLTPNRSAGDRHGSADGVAPDSTAGPAAGAPSFGSLDPRRLLAEYVASFENGGTGSDFFRMAVAAYAWPLRRELREIVADATANLELRLQVLAMFEGGSFRGDPETIDTLLGLLRHEDWEAGASKALDVLAHIGNPQTAGLLEPIALGLSPVKLRVKAYGLIASLLGEAADPALLRLFEREREEQALIGLLGKFPAHDVAAAVRAFELASRLEFNVRLEAAGMIGSHRDEAFVALVEDWLARETEEAVRERLRGALEKQRSIPSWHELQATGAPDVANVNADDTKAWASAQADGGREWLELTYATPLRANRVTVHETCAAGAVAAVEIEENGRWTTVWSGDDPTAAGGPFTIRFDTTRRPVARVRVVLDTQRSPGWNEIDAVELAGPDGAAWASGARASSRYGTGRSELFNIESGVNFERLLRGDYKQR